MRRVIGAALQEAALDPLLTGRDHLRLQATLQGISRAERKPRAQELLDRVGLERGGRPQGQGLLGRDEAAARPGPRPRPPAADPLPRRADDRPRPPEPHGALGRGGPARPRGRRHRLPDDAVPRGGRRAREPGRDHRPRSHRRRGNAGRAQGRDRPAERPRGPCRGGGPRAARRRARSLRRGARRRHAATSPSGCARASLGCRLSCAPSTRRSDAREPRDPGAVARRRLPRQDRPLARRRRRGRAGRGRVAA